MEYTHARATGRFVTAPKVKLATPARAAVAVMRSLRISKFIRTIIFHMIDEGNYETNPLCNSYSLRLRRRLFGPSNHRDRFRRSGREVKPRWKSSDVSLWCWCYLSRASCERTLTEMMYAIVAKVVKPARTSRNTVELRVWPCYKLRSAIYAQQSWVTEGNKLFTRGKPLS